MMKKWNRLIFMLFACLLLAGLLYGLTPHAFAAETVTYLDENGVRQTTELWSRVSDGTSVSLSNGFWLLDENRAPGTVYINGNNVNLVLADGCELKAQAIHLTKNNKLTVWAQSTEEAVMGKITLTGQTMGGYYAAIGAYVSRNGTRYDAGTLVINGGRLTVDGYSAAGIGGCWTYESASDSYVELDGGAVTVNAGIVTATGRGTSPAIGGKNAKITINGGSVTATGSPGIGGTAATVTINGGSVTATGYDNAAGIGNGQDREAALVTINGGSVTATGGACGAGIGGGEYSEGSVVIHGGDVTATGGDRAAGIGGGKSRIGTVTVNGGSIKVYGESRTVGIGGGDGAFCDVKLLGGNVDATDLYIGSGDEYRYGGDVLFGWTNYGDSYKAARYRGILSRVEGKSFLTTQRNTKIEDMAAFNDNCLNATLIPCACVLSFDGNGGTGEMDVIYSNPTDAWICLPDCGFTAPEGKQFYCWNVNGRYYLAGEYCNPPTDTVIYAVWEQPDPVSSVTVTTDQNLDKLYIGTSFYVRAEVLPATALTSAVSWSSSDYWTASVSDTGSVYCRKLGTVTIYATAMDGSGVSGSLELTIRPTPVSGLTVNLQSAAMRVGTTQTASVTVTPDDAADKRVAWSSTNESVATIDENGVIRAVALGTAEIRATAQDGSGVVGAATIRVLNADLKSVDYLDENGTLQTAQNVISVCDADWTEGWYVAEGDLTLDTRAAVSGDVHLILKDGCKLTVSGGIRVNDANDTCFTVYAQSAGSGMGRLVAGCRENHAAAIGSDRWFGSGLITINGGFVEAYGFLHGAGIGGGGNGSGHVVIHGGNVTASSGEYASGIGGGNQCGGIVTITGGTVNATGGECAAGIGGGNQGEGIVTITGGTVIATGGPYAAAIGGGNYGNATVTISGGQITANADRNNGSGIGGGYGKGGIISLSWTDAQNDSFTASSWNGDAALKKAFQYLNSGAAVTIPITNGKTLLPLDGPLTITYQIENGTWSDGTSDPIVLQVDGGTQITDIPTGMQPNPGYGLCRWDIDPTGKTVTEHMTFTFSYYHNTITYNTGGIGTAPAPAQSTWSGNSANGDPDRDWFDTTVYAEPIWTDDSYKPYETYDPNKGTVSWFLNPNDETTGVAPWDFVDDDVTLYCKWTQATKLVDAVALTVTAPKAGDPVPTEDYNVGYGQQLGDYNLSIPDGADYSVFWVEWTDADGNKDDLNFEPGKTYVMRAMVSTGDDESSTVYFKGHASGEAYTLTVNGDPVDASIESIEPTTSMLRIEYTVPAIPSEQMYFVGHSLTLQDDIGINFIVDLGTADPEAATVDFLWTVELPNGTTVEKTESVSLSALTPIEAGEPCAGCYKVPVHVAAKEMTDIVTATLKQNGVEVKKNQYSVQTYAMTILADTEHMTYSEALWNLARAMLIYGAKAQCVFGYRTWFPADEGIDYTQTAPTGLKKNTLPDNFGDFGLEYSGSTLLLKTRTSYRLYFKITDPETFENTVVTLNGTPLQWQKKPTDSEIYYEIPSIAASCILNEVPLTFMNGSKSYDASVSTQDYIRAALDGDNENLKNVVIAICDYCKAAAAYFNSLPQSGS